MQQARGCYTGRADEADELQVWADEAWRHSSAVPAEDLSGFVRGESHLGSQSASAAGVSNHSPADFDGHVARRERTKEMRLRSPQGFRRKPVPTSGTATTVAAITGRPDGL